MEHNLIENCFPPDDVEYDAHCIMNWNTNNIRVSYNVMRACSGDGFHTGMTREPFSSTRTQRHNGDPACTSNVSFDTTIIGNRIIAVPREVPVTLGSTTTQVVRVIGEDGIDIKRTGQGLVIRDNLIFGYRSLGKTGALGYDPRARTIPYAGTGDAGGGGGIGLQGSIVAYDPDPNPGPTADERCLESCAIIDNNQIVNNQTGISIGENPNCGEPFGVIVERNYIAESRGVDLASFDPGGRDDDRGVGIKVSLQQQEDMYGTIISHNSVLNSYADSIQLTGNSPAVEVGRNNLILWAGGGGNCGGPNEAFFDVNWWHAAPTPWPTGRVADGPVDFWSDLGLAPLPHPSAAVCGGASDAGSNTASYSSIPFSSYPRDYRTAPDSSQVANLEISGDGASCYDPVDCQFGAPVNPSFCGNRPDFGANEACEPAALAKVWMKDIPPDSGLEDACLLPSAVACSHSPDLALVRDQNLVRMPSNSDQPLYNEALPAGEDGWAIVRIRGGYPGPLGGPGPAPGEEVRVRLFASAPGLAGPFPAYHALVADAAIPWFGATSGTDAHGTEWRRVAGDSGAQVYAFKIRPMGASPNMTGFRLFSTRSDTLRAEISSHGDPRPPFFSRPHFSNNLAERRITVERRPARTGSFGFYTTRMDSGYPHDFLVTIPARLSVSLIQLPPGGDEIVDDSFDPPFPPDPSRGVTWELIEGANRIQPAADGAETTRYQLLVNSTDGPPDPSASILIEFFDSEGQVQDVYTWRPSAPGFREGFEWGIPPDWTATGLWRATDRFAEPGCGSAEFGRRSAAYNDAGHGCRYSESSELHGELISPYFDVPNVGSPHLSFSHWSETERRAGRDVRRIWVGEVNGPWIQLKVWDGQDSGSPDEWMREHLSLEDWKGKQVRVKFEFHAGDDFVNRYRGWHIDDVELT